MTAIAAVLALSSTSLIAQTVTAPAETATAASAPVMTPAPVAPVTPTTAAPAGTDPLAPAVPPIAETVAADTPEASSTPVKSKSVAKTSTTRTVKSPSVAKGAPAVTRPVTSSASPEIAKATPPAPTAVTTPIAADVAPAPTVAEAAPSQSTMQADEVLPIAGAAGAGLLALAGIGVAVRRRKRDEDEIIVEQEPVLETSHEQVVEPTFVPAPIAASPVVTGPTDDDEFHDEFDLSKYGPNVQAAYRGPTTDNPSLSLRKRLKRGAALDQLARNAGEAMPSAARSSPKPIGSSDSFMLRPSPLQTSFRPVLQS